MPTDHCLWVQFFPSHTEYAGLSLYTDPFPSVLDPNPCPPYLHPLPCPSSVVPHLQLGQVEDQNMAMS